VEFSEESQTRAFAAVALVLYLVYLSNLTGSWATPLSRLLDYAPGVEAIPVDVPFVHGNFETMLSFIGGALALALGFRQSAWEPSEGTAVYLLHIPFSRRTIILTKLALGAGLLLACTLFPIVAYGAWAATRALIPARSSGR
jgi:ABC-type transport system involved in multi-copper enzyme maturation permease subunit